MSITHSLILCTEIFSKRRKIFSSNCRGSRVGFCIKCRLYYEKSVLVAAGTKNGPIHPDGGELSQRVPRRNNFSPPKMTAKDGKTGFPAAPTKNSILYGKNEMLVEATTECAMVVLVSE